jgi:heterodisulfide reductase subunit C
MKTAGSIVRPDSSFLREVEKVSGPISPCYHCNKCSSGCPVAFAMDVLPHRLVRMIQMGLKREVLTSSTIWLCASCEACTTRCPNEIDIAGLMDVLREMAFRTGAPLGEKSIACFHDAFLAAVEKRGRVFETGMLAYYKMSTRDVGSLASDARMGWELFKRGKLRLLPASIRGRHEVGALFRRSRMPSKPEDSD